MFDRGRLRLHTGTSEGNRRWTRADYTVKGRTLTIEITGYGGEAPNGSAEKTGEIFTYRWSLYRDRLTLGPVAGAVSPAVWSAQPLAARQRRARERLDVARGSRRRAGSPPRAGSRR